MAFFCLYIFWGVIDLHIMDKRSNGDILIHPERGKKEQSIPEIGILLVNPAEAVAAMQMVLGQGGHKRFLFHSNLVVNGQNDFFVAGPAVGAPMAAMTMEKLIALGAKKILLYGWCGAVSEEFAVGDILLGGAAHCGEGTSRYYGEQNVYFPSAPFLKRIRSIVSVQRESPMWTTDAIYRESRLMLQQLAARYAVCGVDMEYSALCAVATFRTIQFGALFLVSDELWQKQWRPGYMDKKFLQKSRTLIELLLQNIETLND